MIGIVVFALLVAAAVMEVLSLGPNARKLRVDYETDLSLAAPGEVITLRYRIYNLSPLPKLFCSVSFYFGDSAVICEPEEWKARYARRTTAGVSVQRHMALLPHTSVSGKVRFSLTERGVHPVGKLYLETGDFLGFRSTVVSKEAEKTVVCTARLLDEEPEMQTLGGVLGEISVRRFIHEDPTMIVGYRDYTGREPMKKISWTATAKAARLMVKENDFTVDTNVAVVVNMQDPNRARMERCLSLARTACECLEEHKIPYALLSNGDLSSMEEGLGKGHIFAILRKIGVSRLGVYESFRSLAERCVKERRDNRSYIVITPTPDPESEAVLRLLQQHSDCELCVLYGNGGVSA